eukprot:4573848-Amphidinium_carterae.1
MWPSLFAITTSGFGFSNTMPLKQKHCIHNKTLKHIRNILAQGIRALPASPLLLVVATGREGEHPLLSNGSHRHKSNPDGM